MQAEKLASDTVEILATAIVDPAAVARSTEIHDLVRWWFRQNDQLTTFEAFTANPWNNARMRDLVRQAVEHDAAFARSLTAAIDQAGAPARTQTNSVHVDATGARGGKFIAAGRDIHQTSGTDPGGGRALLAVAALLTLFIAVGIFVAVLAQQR